MRRRHRYLAGAGLVGAFLALGLGFRFGPAVGLAVNLALPSLESRLGAPGPAAAREEIAIPAAGRLLPADLYRPATLRGALLLVHGLSRSGRRHPELQRLARLLAGRGQLVLVPEIEGLTAFTLGGREVEEIRAALVHLRGLGIRVGIAGFSFGAGPALIAAADVPDTRVVASFGGYADLRHVVAYITTGVHEFGGRRYVQRQEEYNRWKLLALLTGFVEDARDRRLLETIAERKLANPLEETGSKEATLGNEGQRVLAVVLNRREDAVAPLLAGLPPRAGEALAGLSPLSAVPRLGGRVLIAHGAGDDSIPFTESLRLADAAGGRARVAILRTFHHTGHHTGPQGLWDSLSHPVQDGWSLVRILDDLLAAT